MTTGKIAYLSVDNPALPRSSDQTLVIALASGSKPALGELFQRYHRDVYRFLARLVGPSAPDLDDLVQNTFIEAARSASRFEGRSTPKTWLFGIAANVSRMRMRSEQRRFRALARLTLLPKTAGTPTPLEQTESRDALRRLQESIQALPPKLRTVFVLCALEDVPSAEAAHALGIPQGTIWRRLHDARVRLMRDMGKEV